MENQNIGNTPYLNCLKVISAVQLPSLLIDGIAVHVALPVNHCR